MSLLESIHGPRDLDDLSVPQLKQLAQEIRDFLIENVARTGGHLGPNLGVVELTIALHRVFDSPQDPFVFDTGHQSYVHKLLTGRQDFGALRSRGGLAGYPQRSESEHDVVESSHASSSLSWADGISRALTRTGRKDRHVIAVVGDGAVAWPRDRAADAPGLVIAFVVVAILTFMGRRRLLYHEVVELGRWPVFAVGAMTGAFLGSQLALAGLRLVPQEELDALIEPWLGTGIASATAQASSHSARGSANTRESGVSTASATAGASSATTATASASHVHVWP